ncbi:hypothetical protein IMCC9480_3745 [Oxalobacteraceae bacterium IMCC9480]|nr:hypothetical protein IMCC9480_3745 [Oxalobacteraceae bacterium IMCC9480]
MQDLIVNAAAYFLVNGHRQIDQRTIYGQPCHKLTIPSMRLSTYLA